MAFLIQGFFFQERPQLGIGYDSKEGPRAVISKIEVQHMFAGAIWEPLKGGELVGKITDAFGTADLFDISIDEDGVSFVKKYQKGRKEIRYALRTKDGGSWVGRYQVPEADGGVVRCILTEVSEDFFESEPIMELLRTQAK